MSGRRTPEQVAADEKLTEAVNGVVEAYGYLEPGFINTEYVVLVSQRGWRLEDDAGEGFSGFCTLYKDGSMAWSSILGLLRAATLKEEHNFLRPDPEDGDDE